MQPGESGRDLQSLLCLARGRQVGQIAMAIVRTLFATVRAVVTAIVVDEIHHGDAIRSGLSSRVQHRCRFMIGSEDTAEVVATGTLPVIFVILRMCTT